MLRRDFFKTVPGMAALSVPAMAAGSALFATPVEAAEKIKISDVRLIKIKLVKDKGEVPRRVGWSVFENPPMLEKDGMIKVPQGPGLGVTFRKDLIEQV